MFLSWNFIFNLCSNKVQDKDYDKVVNCLSKHIPKIYDESLPPESELIYVRTKSSRQTNGSKRSAIKVNLIPENERKSFEDKSLDEDGIVVLFIFKVYYPK